MFPGTLQHHTYCSLHTYIQLRTHNYAHTACI